MNSSTASATPFVEDEFVARQRRELRSRRTAYREQIERLLAAADELAHAREAPDLGDEQGFAEADSLSVEQDRILSLTALARRRIEEIDAALRRLEAGTYGGCRTCRRPIPVVRLEAVPEATQCVSCATGSSLRRR